MERLDEMMGFCLKRSRAFFAKKSKEPFRHLPRGLSCVYFIAEAILFPLSTLAIVWLDDEARKRKCVVHWTYHSIIWPTYALALVLVFYMSFIMSSKIQNVFKSELDFPFERAIQEIGEASNIKLSYRLGPTTKALQETVARARRGEIPLLTATAFLYSDRGRKFLKKVKRRVTRSLGVVQRTQLVRKERRAFWLLGEFVIITVLSSMAGAFQMARISDNAVETCSARFLLWQFLNNMSLSLIAIFAIMTFAGVGTMTEFASEPVHNVPLTHDEKFLVSLLAANTNEPFYGVARSEASGYANIVNEGADEIFIPLHMSLFAFKPVRVADQGHNRLYKEEFEDCVGNFVVGPVEV